MKIYGSIVSSCWTWRGLHYALDLSYRPWEDASNICERGEGASSSPKENIDDKEDAAADDGLLCVTDMFHLEMISCPID